MQQKPVHHTEGTVTASSEPTFGLTLTMPPKGPPSINCQVMSGSAAPKGHMEVTAGEVSGAPPLIPGAEHRTKDFRLKC